MSEDNAPFDPTDPRDAASDAVRKIVLDAFIQASNVLHPKTDEDIADIMGGLMTGIVSIAMAHMKETDEAHSGIRDYLLTSVPWAIDWVRAMKDMPPLPERTLN